MALIRGAEIDKWIPGKCKYTAITDSVKAKVVAKIDGFQYDLNVRFAIIHDD